MKNGTFDIVIVGGGVTGTALLYVLSKYSSVKRIALVEKYDQVAQVSSHHSNNSQTLHFGDIETNYSVDKARTVKEAAEMVVRFSERLEDEDGALTKVQKMVLAVGVDEVAELEKRYDEFRELFPNLEKLDREALSEWEPNVVKGREEREELLGMGTKDGWAVDYAKLSELFVREAKKSGKDITLFMDTKVDTIDQTEEGFRAVMGKASVAARSVVVSAGAHSLLFARSMGYGNTLSTLPIDGNFYYSRELLRGKVYTMQLKKLPFAAVHGDPDVGVPGKTRYGPTAKVMPYLESGKWDTILDFFKSSGMGRGAIISWIKLLSDPVMFRYILKNLWYDVPYFGKRSFATYVRKIIPSIKAEDIELAKDVGGMRPQVIDNSKRELVMGAGRIVGKKVIFNMTPSPGATVCLKTAEDDAKDIIKQLEGVEFDTESFERDFY